MPAVVPTLRIRGALPAALAAAGALLLPASAVGQDAAGTARETLSALIAQEAVAPAARLTIETADRRAEYREGEKLEETRRRLAAQPAFRAEGTLVYRPEGWLKDLLLRPPGSNGASFRTRTSEVRGILRSLVEAKSEAREEKSARVIRVATTAPADAVLTRRSGRILQEVQWTAARAEGDLLMLDGRRDREHHQVTLYRGPASQVRSWSLVRELQGPDGRRFTQRYACEVTPGTPEGSIDRLEEWVVNPPPLGNVTLRTTTVRRVEPAPELKEAALAVRFPRGTQVTDARGEVPLEYEQTEEGVDEAAVAEAARALAAGRARVGDPAPPFELPDTRGKRVALPALRGRTVLLFWFSSRSRPAEAAGKFIGDLEADYRKRPFQIVAINVAEEGVPDKPAEEFRKRFKWGFPVALDPQGETLRLYGTEAAVPKVAIVDREGRLVYVQSGVDPEAITAHLERLTAPAK